TVEEGKTSETTLEFVEGMSFDKGYISPYFVTTQDMTCEFEDTLILIHEKKLANVRDMLPLLERVAQDSKRRPLLIIAEDGEGKKADIQKRIEQIRAQMEQTESEYDKEKFSERLAKLTGGVAIIRVGGATEAEMKQTKGRVEDALHATRAAVAEGIVAGGGT